MTVTLHLPPELEANLAAGASASGMPLEDYLLRLVERMSLSTGAGTSSEDRVGAVRKMIEFGDKYRLSFGSEITRADLHQEHRF